MKINYHEPTVGSVEIYGSTKDRKIRIARSQPFLPKGKLYLTCLQDEGVMFDLIIDASDIFELAAIIRDGEL